MVAIRTFLIVTVLGCGPSSSSSAKPAGTMSDPVDVCERVADVCRLDKSQLGVCVSGRGTIALVCAAQH